ELACVFMLGSPSIGVDTESSGYYTYYSKVCLIQITCKDKNYLIDPLAKISLKPLEQVFSSPKVLKVFHSAIDDIKALKRDFGFTFQNIADTMYSSKLLGFEHNSLNYIVEKYFQVKLSKTEQKSNWEKRPLDKYQLKYAVLDTVYLCPIWERMKEELEKAELLEEALSEFEKMTEEVYHGRETTQENHWYKFKNILKYTPEQRRKIHDLLEYREEKARKTNKAPFRIFNSEVIHSLASAEEINEELIAKYIHNKKDIQEVLNILKNPSGPPLEKSDIPKFDLGIAPNVRARLRMLRKWRQKIIQKRKIHHTMIISNRQMIQLLENPPKNLQELEKLNLMSKWKVKNYGPSLLKALNNEPYDDLIGNLKPILQQKHETESRETFFHSNS
ncbi:MAG: HRDC domain-containing protein, partial [Leptospiraceae bacterium]|nr:HRDC domain-containing protein [Leptospiraceae bacterium]